ncbi:M20/M25/M40 family metallo-hydrolase [Mucilaginibacter myungsuensis]|uniref:Carboxypeptidase Q n=1 Tax=Mucilaginibacter myungsuensis TaxID=649104 RepID=A0A929PYA6_9SPHI|nr:M20/M25/M40 family metallo-hydrolase [Mucilaginibacter myungsuensis]MBE9663979.1 M20/M25/M40 family metallo-hydrolase [Mucilaginibacter myungsuensis]MDN3601158.1 M20/M25/M40 family metallo-hydrolase [Mucilaginibacter myungsuensis]
MKKTLLSISTFLLALTTANAQTDSVMLRKIFDEALVNGQVYENLRYLCKKIGPRLSGSANAQKSVEWGKKLMEGYGFDKVFLQEVMVPHWERGAKEQGYIIDGNKKIPVPICALGMAVATPAAGITASVIEVKSLAEVEQLGESVIKGKIVFYNRPFDNRFIETSGAYGGAGDQRRSGPSVAAKYGAVGVIVRSLTAANDDYPHTGTTQYSDDAPKIPAAAISTKAADKLSAMLKLRKFPQAKFFFKQSCRMLPDAKSYNVVGEITGTENPNKFITVGGHLDSWDLAEGAHDDGTGVMQSVEVLRIFKAMGIKPKNSIRAVLFMNEENGTKGGLKYAELAAANKEQHIAAIETDEGGFTPRGFSFEGFNAARVKEMNTRFKKLFEPYEADRLVNGGGGADIGPLKQTHPGVALIGFRPDSQRYFDIHHTPNDVFENVNKRELELGAAAIASLVYLIDKGGI